MRGLWILLLAAAVFWLLGQIRLGVGAEYRAEGLRVWLRTAAWNIQVFPRKKKRRAKPERPPKQVPEKGDAPKSALPRQIGGALDYARALLPILLEAAGQFRRKIRVDKLRVTVTVGAADPADAAMRFGAANGALGALWGTLNETFDLRDGEARAQVDFDARETTVYALTALSLKLGQMAWLGLYFGCRTLGAFLRTNSRKKQEQQQRKAV